MIKILKKILGIDALQLEIERQSNLLDDARNDYNDSLETIERLTKQVQIFKDQFGVTVDYSDSGWDQSLMFLMQRGRDPRVKVYDITGMNFNDLVKILNNMGLKDTTVDSPRYRASLPRFRNPFNF